MSKFWNIVSRVTDAADVVLLMLDARMIEETRNRDIEKMVIKTGRPLIYVITKRDLITQETMQRWKRELSPCVFVSSTTYHGLAQLKELILTEARKADIHKRKIEVGVLGYPNVGKSSLINAMTGRSSAKASPRAGLTRSRKRISSVRGNIVFVDTPGIIPTSERKPRLSSVKHAMIGAVDYDREKEPDLVIFALMEKHPGLIEKHYGVPAHDDKEETLVAIALKRRLLSKGNTPNIRRTAVLILKEWQAGEIR